MPALAILLERLAGDVGLIGIDGHQLDLGPRHEQIELSDPLIAVSGLHDDGCLDKSGSGHEPGVIGVNGLVESPPFGLIPEDGYHRRSVNDH
jgi:hypothetical protein